MYIADEKKKKKKANQSEYAKNVNVAHVNKIS